MDLENEIKRLKKIVYFLQRSISGGGGGSGIVESIVAGTNITVVDTDPANPIISASSSDNIDGGFADSVYLVTQVADGGPA